jgi:catechol-2,3-dioxygenase
MQLDYIDHFAISVKNLQTSFDWYKKVFGFEMFHQWKTTWLIHLGDMKIGLFERPQAAAVDDLDNKIAFQHLAFHVSADDLIAALIELANLGIEFDGPEDTGVAYSLFVSDPDGHLLELTTYYGEKSIPTASARESCAGIRKFQHTRGKG